MTTRGESRRPQAVGAVAPAMGHDAAGGRSPSLEQLDRVVNALAGELAARAVVVLGRNGQLLAASGNSRAPEGASLASLTAFTMGRGAISALHAEQEGCFAVPGSGASAVLCLCRRRALLAVVLDTALATPRARERSRTAAQAVADILGDVVRSAQPGRGGDAPFAELSEEDLAGLFAV